MWQWYCLLPIATRIFSQMPQTSKKLLISALSPLPWTLSPPMLLVSGIILYPVVQLETSESSWSHFWSVFSHIQTDPGIEYVLSFLLSVSLSFLMVFLSSSPGHFSPSSTLWPEWTLQPRTQMCLPKRLLVFPFYRMKSKFLGMMLKGLKSILKCRW